MTSKVACQLLCTCIEKEPDVRALLKIKIKKQRMEKKQKKRLLPVFGARLRNLLLNCGRHLLRAELAALTIDILSILQNAQENGSFHESRH